MFCRLIRIVAFLSAIVATVAPAMAQTRQIEKGKATQRTHFTDAQIADGFFKTAFGAELRLAGQSNRIRKYVVPIRIAIENRAKPDRRAAIEAVVADIKAHIKGIDIALAGKGEKPNVEIHLVAKRNLVKGFGQYFGRQYVRDIRKKLEPECLSGFRKDAKFQIIHSDVLIAADTSTFIFYDCIYEELLQSLGPINDTSTNSNTMFNDDIQRGFFDIFDQYILNILYDPRIRPGMTAAQVRALLPRVMPDVRAWVTKANNLRK
jgi:hypothetical protein